MFIDGFNIKDFQVEQRNLKFTFSNHIIPSPGPIFMNNPERQYHHQVSNEFPGPRIEGDQGSLIQNMYSSLKILKIEKFSIVV